MVPSDWPNGRIPSSTHDDSQVSASVEPTFSTARPATNEPPCQVLTATEAQRASAPLLTLASLLTIPIPSLYSLNSVFIHYPLDYFHYALFQLLFIVAIPSLLDGLYYMLGLSPAPRSTPVAAPPARPATKGSKEAEMSVPERPTVSKRPSVAMIVSPVRRTQPAEVLAAGEEPPALNLASTTDAAKPSLQSPPAITRPPTPTHRYAADCDIIAAELLATIEPPIPEEGKWSLVFEQTSPTFLQVHQSKQQDFCFKMTAVIRNTAETAFDLLADAMRRPEWDDMCDSVRIIENLDGPGAPLTATTDPANTYPTTTRIQYVRTKPIWPTSARDVCLLSHNRRLPGDRYMSVTRSIQHPDCPEYSAQGFVRMSAGVSGQIITPLTLITSPSGPSCRVVQIADGSPGGWLPQSVVKFVATKAMPQSFKKVIAQIEKLTPQEDSVLLPKAVPAPAAEPIVNPPSEPAPALPAEPPAEFKFAPFADECDHMVRQLVTLVDGHDDATPWTVVHEETAPIPITVYRNYASPPCFKVVGLVPNSMYAVFDVVADTPRRPEWDTNCAQAKVIETLDGDLHSPPRSKIVYLQTNPHWPVTARDACLLSHNRTMPDGRLLQVTHSTTHPQCPPRDAEGLVRMNTIIAGTVVKPAVDPANPTTTASVPRCQITMVVNLDLGGWVPLGMIHSVLAKNLVANITRLNQTVAALPIQTASTLLPDGANSPRALIPRKAFDQDRQSSLAPKLTQEELVQKILSLESKVAQMSQHERSTQLRGRTPGSPSMADSVTRQEMRWYWVKPFLKWVGPLVVAAVWSVVLPKWRRR
ncbi:hypothetical protein H4R34_002627 [Dimargaris verticillata]|uniref:START domain-containing protein n=1 Tax=Dimargaris verticillata TaxID=2761393 RepID=A0A9W8ECR3_9FUNG|nr:hypothetical protein H4R34_002627 [Dimargaris verticillata]